MEEGYDEVLLPGRDLCINVCEQLNLPLGFRFHPTDEELVTYYLSRKVADHGFSAGGVIGEVDLNKCEPWDLPWRGATTGEKEWYFFCVRDRKYPAGLRANRATDSGYWKATGKDKEVRRRHDHQGKSTSQLVGRKKTLVFYEGRAPKGDKTPWVMHEYRLDGRLAHISLCNNAAAAAAATKNEWVICRVFQRGSRYAAAAAAAAAPQGGGDGAGKKVPGRLLQERRPAIPPAACYRGGGVSSTNTSHDLLPPLMDLPFGGGAGTVGATTAAPGADDHVTCFSNVAAGGHKSHEGVLPADFATTSSPFLMISGASAETDHSFINDCSSGAVSSSVLSLPRGRFPGEAGVLMNLQVRSSHGYAVQEGIGGGAETGAGTSGASQETPADMHGRPASSPRLLVSGHEVFGGQKIPSDPAGITIIPLADCISWNY